MAWQEKLKVDFTHLPRKWITWFFGPIANWCESKQVFPLDGTITMKETPMGVGLSVAPTPLAEASDLEPLQIIPAGSRFRVVAGKCNASYIDPAIDPQEDGSTAHPFYYYPKKNVPGFADDPDLVDGDRFYAEVTMSFDATYWREDSMKLVAAAATPANTATKWYHEISPITVNANNIVSIPNPQPWLGNIVHVRRGTAAVYADDFGHP